MTAADMKQTLPELSSVCERLIQRHLQTTLNSHSAAQKLLLMIKIKMKQLAFCRAYKNWTEDDWDKVMFILLKTCGTS